MDTNQERVESNFHDAPEIYIPDGLEPISHARRSPPETAIGEGIERSYEGEGLEVKRGEEKEAVKEDKPNLQNHSLTNSRRHWRWLALVVIIVVCAVIAGTIGGVLGHRSKSNTSQAASSSSSVPTPLPTAQNTTSPGSPKPSYTVQNITALAATTCFNGDKWIFIQDTDGSVRGILKPASSLVWNVTSPSLNYSSALIGTALSASCIDIPTGQQGVSTSLAGGQYISLVYFNGSNTLQQSIYNGGSWRNSPIARPLDPPANGTKLSSSTVISISQLEADGLAGNPYPGQSLLSSVAVYESVNTSLVAVNISPDDNTAGGQFQSNNSNLLSRFSEGYVGLQAGVGFSCIYNALTPPNNSSQLYTRYAYGINEASRILSLSDITFYYNATTLFGTQSINISESGFPIYNNNSIGTDISLIQLPNNNSALIYLQPNNTNTIVFSSPATAQEVEDYGDIIYHNPNQQQSPFQIPFQRFDATACTSNSTAVCIYYQVNSSALAEISYDPDSQNFVQEPTYIMIT